MDGLRFATLVLLSLIALDSSCVQTVSSGLSPQQGLVVMAQCCSIGEKIQAIPKNIVDNVRVACCLCAQQVPIAQCAAAIIHGNYNDKLLALKKLLSQQDLEAAHLQQFVVSTANEIQMQCRFCRITTQWR
ncbi:hypothetical protein FJ365_02100 [Candidatus Dependentiae bacterium]|nr:hypothetical protein [Candidatus Dependentiae bacterium]